MQIFSGGKLLKYVMTELRKGVASRFDVISPSVNFEQHYITNTTQSCLLTSEPIKVTTLQATAFGNLVVAVETKEYCIIWSSC